MKSNVEFQFVKIPKRILYDGDDLKLYEAGHSISIPGEMDIRFKVSELKYVEDLEALIGKKQFQKIIKEGSLVFDAKWNTYLGTDNVLARFIVGQNWLIIVSVSEKQPARYIMNLEGVWEIEEESIQEQEPIKPLKEHFKSITDLASLYDGSPKRKPKGSDSAPIANEIANRLWKELNSHFGYRITSDCEIVRIMDKPYVEIEMFFSMYNFFQVQLGANSEEFTFGIKSSEKYFPVSNRTYDLVKSDYLLESLSDFQRRIELRIPDKYMNEFLENESLN